MCVWQLRESYLNANEVQPRHRREKLIVVEPPGQSNIKVLEDLLKGHEHD